MTEQLDGRGQGASKPYKLDELLGFRPKRLPFKENLTEGSKHEGRVRTLLALEGLNCYGITPGKHEDGSSPNYAKEQKDIVICPEVIFVPDAPWNDSSKQFSPTDLKVLAESWRKEFNTRNYHLPVEVKSHSKRFKGLEDFPQPFVTLDGVEPWSQKDPRPIAVVTISQKATDEELLRGEGLLVAICEDVRPYVYSEWIKPNGRSEREVFRVPLEYCCHWTAFTERLTSTTQNPCFAITNFTKGPST
jgi:hypothetical protein